MHEVLGSAPRLRKIMIMILSTWNGIYGSLSKLAQHTQGLGSILAQPKINMKTKIITFYMNLFFLTNAFIKWLMVGWLYKNVNVLNFKEICTLNFKTDKFYALCMLLLQ